MLVLLGHGDQVQCIKKSCITRQLAESEAFSICMPIIDDRVHYCVDWKPTWEPESELAGAEELISDYLAAPKHAQSVALPKEQRGLPPKQRKTALTEA